MEPREGAEFWKACSILGLFLGIVLGISASAWMHKLPGQQDVRMSDVTCFANPSSFMAIEGWMRLWDADRVKVTALISEGKAELQREDSLVCHDVRPGGGPYRVVIGEFWWRRI